MTVGNLRNRWHLAFASTFLALLTMAATGCGNSMAKVDGAVTLDGQPVRGSSDTRGTVYFYPEGTTGSPAIGLLDESGRYTVSTGSQRGLPPGPYVVTVAATQLIPPKQPGEAPGGRRITPPKYADPRESGFRVEVEPGSNTFDFDLESQSTSRRR